MMTNQITAPKHRAATPSLRTYLHAALMGERQLRQARQTLSSLRAQYRANNYSGHPEDMLDNIDGAEQRVKLLETAKKRKWIPDAKLIQRLETELCSMEEEFTEGKFRNMPEDMKVSNLNMLQRELDKARMGLR